MINILDSYIPKFLVDLNRENDDVITVTTNYLSTEGDAYQLDTRTISPVLIQTTQSLQELRPEVSNVYPFKIVTPIDVDGSTIILSPTPETIPTASQGYYVPIYFERYNTQFLENIDKNFSDSISISPGNAVLYRSSPTLNTLNLTAVVTDAFDNPIPIQKITWNSSNTNVVRVTPNGQLTAISTGSAVITVTYDNAVSNQIIATVLD